MGQHRPSLSTTTALLIAVAFATAPLQTRGAGSFDGTYSGTVSVVAPSNPNCTWVVGGSVTPTVTDSLTIANNHFNYTAHSAPVSVDVAADGSFHATGLLRAARQAIPQEFSGRIVGGVLQATVEGAGGGCRFQLSLKKQ